MHDLMAAPMRAPQPVHVRFAAQRDRQPGVRVAEAFRLDRLRDVGGAVPAGGRLRVPERTVLYVAQEIEPHGAMAQIVRIVVVVELHDVQFLVHVQIVHAVHWHDVRADGNLHVFLEDLRLHRHELHDGLLLEDLPFQAVVRVDPRVARRRDFIEEIVLLAENRQIPRLVQGVHRAVFRLQTLFELLRADWAHATVAEGIDFVVDLPADDVFVVRELLRHLLDDPAAVFAVMFVVRAAVAAAAMLRAASMFLLHKDIGIFAAEPDGRRRRRRAQDRGDSVFRQRVDDMVQPVEREDAFRVLHAAPRKFRDASDLDADRLHLRGVLLDFLHGPVFRIVGAAQIRRFDVDHR